MASELAIHVYDLPPMLGTEEVHALFSRYGEIMHIMLPKREVGQLYAKIVFSPNPRHTPGIFPPIPCFKRFQMTSNHIVNVRIELVPPRGTPLNRPRLALSEKAGEDKMIARADLLSFGFLRQPGQVQIMRSERASNVSDVHFELDLGRGRKEVKITFPTTTYGISKVYRLQIPLHQMECILQTVNDEERFDYVISLKSPPALWSRDEGSGNSFTVAQTSWSRNQHWSRATDIALPGEDLNRLPMTVSSERAHIKIGTWTTYRLGFTRSRVPKDILQALQLSLQENNISIKHSPIEFMTGPAESVWDWLDRPSHTGKAGSSSWLSEMLATAPMEFEVRYALEVCISNGILSEYNITRDFVDKLKALAPAEAARRLEHLADGGQQMFDPMGLFEMVLPASYSVAKIPSYCTLLRSVTITPSHVYVSSPTVEMSNRIVRQFSEHHDRFLRIRFTDEKTEGKIHARTNSTQEPLYGRVRRALLQGLVVGGRHYDLLASGNSQFRDHGAYFFAANVSLNAQAIRDWIGDLRTIRTVPKYISRMGQCFATTRAINSSKVEIHTLADVVRNGHTFTDGVGKISKFLAQMIATELRLPDPTDPPSLFQFRLGGCKGVLAIAPDASGRQIHIRASQYKFAAAHEGLEIIRCSTFSCADLNRQLITVLSCLGVKEAVFLKKVRQQIRDISEAVEQPKKAVDLLRRRIDQNQMTLQIATIIVDGFLEARDPFAHSILDLWRSWSLKRLKEKARIEVDDGAFVLGCTDESRELIGSFANSTRLPQIFLQVSDLENPGKYKIIQGICIVARNPSLQPGDIRVVEAVDLNSLHHLKNVVVFPQTGDRDLPSMCSGGDLDGDDFFVSWDKQLIPPRPNWNAPAGEYQAHKAEEKGNITKADMAEFYANYMRNDILGKIANAWQANADQAKLDIRGGKCAPLAELHSVAVDFVKSGVPATLNRELEPEKYPHFMPNRFRASNRIYTSRTILGQLYDEVKTRDYHPHLDLPFDARVLYAFDIDDEKLTAARLLKDEYDIAMRRAMAQHEIATEFEVWTAFCLEHNILAGDYKFQELLGELSSTLKERFQDLCIEKAGGKNFEQLGPFVAAMYMVTSQQTAEVLSRLSSVERQDTGRLPFISFPWLFPDMLGRIAVGADRHTVETIKKQQAMHTANARAAQPRAPILLDTNATQDVEIANGVVHPHELLELNFASDSESSFQTGDDSRTEGLPEKKADETHLSDDTLAGDMQELAVDEKEAGDSGKGRKERLDTHMPRPPMARTGIEMRDDAQEAEAASDDDDDDDDEYDEGPVVIQFDSKPTAFDNLRRVVG